MAFSKKTWLQRIVENPGRRLLTPTGTTNVYDIARNEGVVVQAGDAFSVANMNDLETRVYNAITGIEDSLDWIDITSQCTWSSSLLTSYTNYAKANPATRMIEVTCVLSAGRENNAALVTLPSGYKPTLTKNMGLGVAYDSVKTMEIEYYLDTTGNIRGAHTVGTPTGTAEFICFNFTY